MAEIHVPALIESGKMIIPAFYLGDYVEYEKEGKPDDFEDDRYLSAAEYFKRMQLPTLAELRHAYFGASDEYRKYVRRNRNGEWTSTFLKNGDKIIERPENIVCINGMWLAEGGKIAEVELPPEGWTLEYDKPTGFPSRTSKNRKDAERIFGKDASYFWSYHKGLRVVSRSAVLLKEFGPFFIEARNLPKKSYSYIGGREYRKAA